MFVVTKTFYALKNMNIKSHMTRDINAVKYEFIFLRFHSYKQNAMVKGNKFQ